jgi:hypothetical protein
MPRALAFNAEAVDEKRAKRSLCSAYLALKALVYQPFGRAV